MDPASRQVKELSSNTLPALIQVFGDELAQALQLAEGEDIVFLEGEPVVHGEARFVGGVAGVGALLGGGLVTGLFLVAVLVLVLVVFLVVVLIVVLVVATALVLLAFLALTLVVATLILLTLIASTATVVLFASVLILSLVGIDHLPPRDNLVLVAAHLQHDLRPRLAFTLHSNDGLVLRRSPRRILSFRVLVFLRFLGGLCGFALGRLGDLGGCFVRDKSLAAVAAVLKLVVSDASLRTNVWVDRLVGVSVNGKDFERLAEERLDEERHDGRWALASGSEGVRQ